MKTNPALGADHQQAQNRLTKRINSLLAIENEVAA